MQLDAGVARQSENGIELEAIGAPLSLKSASVGAQGYCPAGESALAEDKINLVLA